MHIILMSCVIFPLKIIKFKFFFKKIWGGQTTTIAKKKKKKKRKKQKQKQFRVWPPQRAKKKMLEFGLGVAKPTPKPNGGRATLMTLGDGFNYSHLAPWSSLTTPKDRPPPKSALSHPFGQNGHTYIIIIFLKFLNLILLFFNKKKMTRGIGIGIGIIKYILIKLVLLKLYSLKVKV